MNTVNSYLIKLGLSLGLPLVVASLTALPSYAETKPVDAQLTPSETKTKMEPKDYPDSRGKSVHFPEGDLSFADEIVSFEKGSPSAAPPYCDAKNKIVRAHV